jgi:serine/threonine-protein kinase RsbW
MVWSARQFESDLRQLSAMRAFVREGCRCAWGERASDETLIRLELAVDEAATNIIRHAYGGESGRPIELVIEADEDQVRVSLYHLGRDFDPRAVQPPVFDGSREGGFGLYLIEQAVDEVCYFHDDQGRCGIRLVKKRT